MQAAGNIMRMWSRSGNADRRGAAGSQYAVVLGLIAVVALFAIGTLGRNVTILLTSAGNRIAGQVDNTVSSGSGGGSGGQTAGTISLQTTGLSQAEGNSGSTAFPFVVQRSGGTTNSDQIAWTVTGGTANAADFAGGVLPSGSVTFGAGAASATITVNVAGDTQVESDETFTLTLTGVSGGGTLGAPASATGTIQNDDASSIAITGSGTESQPYMWSNGAVATRCAGYLTGQAGAGYQGVAQAAGSDGVYWVDFDGGSTANASLIYCDMGTGGWMLALKTKTQGYNSAIWSGSISQNLSACLYAAGVNTTNCMNAAPYTWTGWTELKGDNRDAAATSIITPYASGVSFRDHVNGPGYADSRMSTFMRALMPGATGITGYTPTYGWNLTGNPSGGRGAYPVRMVSDTPNLEGFFVGGNSGGCGNFGTVDGNTDCRNATTKTIWFWVR